MTIIVFIIKSIMSKYFSASLKEVKDRSNRILLRDIDLSIERTSAICIAGASGSGKSTLMRILAGHKDSSTYIGNIYFEGKDITNITPYHRRFHSVKHDLHLFYDRTVQYNVEFGWRSDNNMSREDREERLNFLLRKFYILSLKRSRVAELSQGQKNRVALCRALIDKPKILFLDEAFNHIDYYIKNIIIRDLIVILKEWDITVVFITHDVYEMYGLANIVYIIEQQTIVEYSSIEQLNMYPQTCTSARLIAQCNEIKCSIISETETFFYLNYDAGTKFYVSKSMIDSIHVNTRDCGLFFSKYDVTIVDNPEDTQWKISYYRLKSTFMDKRYTSIVTTELGCFSIVTESMCSQKGYIVINRFILFNDYINL